MCKERPNFSEVQLALHQLQGLVDHVQQSTVQWQQYLEQSGTTYWHRDFEEASKQALQLRESLLRIKHTLGERDERNDPFITVTTFK